MFATLLKNLVPSALRRWRGRRALRREADILARLRRPETDFAGLYRACRASGWFTTLQVEQEIVGLLERIDKQGYQTFLEIGTSAGGTLFLLTRAASRHATLITMDLEKDEDRWTCLQRFALDQQRIVCLQGNSNDPETRRQVDAMLAGRPVDFLLIDGDHSSYGVRKDFELYAPLVAPGGVVVFHDICLDGGVREFWQEIKGRGRHEELVNNPAQKDCGLGLLYV